MKDIITDCKERRTSNDWCRLSPSCKGWGCRLLTYIPADIPITEHEKAAVFIKVYGMAKENGILDCPFYDSIAIDQLLDNNTELCELVKSAHDRTELLSDDSFSKS